ncbi:beta-ketoacyl synthase N-terminal-like domain-containing protein [Thermodesulfobacteriota bacterium]
MTVITGIGWVTSSGMGSAKNHDSFAIPDGQLPPVTSKSVFDKPYPYFRRMDEYSRLGLVAIAFALQDAGLDEWSEKRNIGIIASTEYGCLNTDIDYFDTVMAQNGIGASPALFTYTLPNSFLGEAAIRFGLNGPTFIIDDRFPLGPGCLQFALDVIAGGETDKMLGGICNLRCPPSFNKMRKVPPGALFFMIETCPRKGSSYGKIRLTNEGHIEFKGTAINDLVSLVQQCMAAKR